MNGQPQRETPEEERHRKTVELLQARSDEFEKLAQSMALQAATAETRATTAEARVKELEERVKELEARDEEASKLLARLGW
jgi:uncharacterized protein YceH (UPF0502 family)